MEFKLRDIKVSDAVSISKHADNIKIARNLTDRFPHPYTLEDAQLFIENIVIKDEHAFIKAIDYKSELIGMIGIHEQSDIYQKNAEFGYWLSEQYWGQGIMSALLPQMIPLGFEYFKITRLYAKVFGSNKASIRILEKSGFILEARIKESFFKFGKFEDELIYAVRKDEFELLV
jgi:[ribosomal protein S5]-alanine N-acetyltransferase